MGKRRAGNATLAMPFARPYREARALRLALLRAERQVAGYNTEVGIVYGPDGKELYRKQGGYDHFGLYGYPNHNVEWTPEEGQRYFPGATFTHNHPGGASFSRADIGTAMDWNMAEIRAVDPNYRHSFRPPTHEYMNHQTGQMERQDSFSLWRDGVIESIGPRGVPVYATGPLQEEFIWIEQQTIRELHTRVQAGQMGLAELAYEAAHIIMERFAAKTRAASQPGVYRRTRWPKGVTIRVEKPIFKEDNQAGYPIFRWAQPGWKPEDGLQGDYGYGPGNTGPDGKPWNPEEHRPKE